MAAILDFLKVLRNTLLHKSRAMLLNYMQF